MALVNILKRNCSSQALAKGLNNIPWNFNAHYRHMEVQSLEAPVDHSKVLPLQQEATSLLKDFVDGICENNLVSMEDRLEPQMLEKANKRLAEFHKQLRQNPALELKVQNMKDHQTEFFLYNIDSYLLCGDVSLNRLKNVPVTNFATEDNAKLKINEREYEATNISNLKSMGPNAEATLVLRMHFVVHTFLNIFVWHKEKQTEVCGHQIRIKNTANKQSHLMTLDKKICSLKLANTLMDSQLQVDQKIVQSFKRTEGLLISQVDNFMTRDNPIVNFQPEWE